MLSMSIHHRRGEGLPWVLCILARHAKYPTGAAYIVIKAERERERERETRLLVTGKTIPYLLGTESESRGKASEL